jgi:ankyrin repeat protein
MRARNFPEEAARWASVKSSSRSQAGRKAEGALRLPLHHACLKLRNCSQKHAAAETIAALLEAHPNAAKERESKHGCLPLHLAAFGVSSHGAQQSVNDRRGGLSRGKSHSVIPSRPFTNTDVSLSHKASLSLSSSSNLSESTHLTEQSGISSMFLDSNGSPNGRLQSRHRRVGSLDRVELMTNEDGGVEVLECQSQAEVAVQIIDKLIKAHPRGCRETSEGGRLPLHMAIAGKASAEVVQALLLVYSDAARQRNHDGYLPLHLAALYGVSDEQVAVHLLRAYPDAAVGRNKFERIPLEEALFNAGENGRVKQEELVKVLRKHPSYWTRPISVSGHGRSASEGGAGIHRSKGGFAPSQRMANLSLMPAVPKSPSSKKLPPSATSPDRSTATSAQDIAELAEATDVTFLIKAGEWEAVKERCRICPGEVAEWLTIQSRSGTTVKCAPLHYALERMPPLDVVEAIVAVAKGDEALSWKMTPGDALPLHVACVWGSSAEVVSYLVKQDNAAVRVKDGGGNLPLHQACFSGSSSRTVDLLCQNWPESVHEANGMGSLPLEIVHRLSHPNKHDVLNVLRRYAGDGSDFSLGSGCEV